MAELSGHATHTVKDFAVENNRAADTCAKCEHGHVVDVAAGAHPFFSESGDVGVVVEIDVRLQASFNDLANGIICPARKVGGQAHDAGRHIDDAGDPDSGANKFAGAAIFFGEGVNGVAHFADDVVASHGDFHAQGNFFEKLSVSCDGCNAQVGAAHIHANGVVRHNGREYQNEGRLAVTWPCA